MVNKREFKGIWIPAEIWLSEDLNATEKMIIAEVHSLSGQQGCFASNSHFAKITGLSPSRCSAIINKLKERNMLKVELIYKENNPKEIAKRILKIDFTYSKSEIPLPDTKGGDFESEDTPISDMKEPPFEYSEDKVPILNYQEESTTTKDGGGESSSQEFNALQDFETLWLFPNQFQLQDLNDLIDQHGKELTSAAIRLAGTKDVVKGKAINFLKAVLKEWAENHVTNSEQVAAYQAKRDQKQKKQYSKPTARTESMPDWADEENKGEEIDEEKQKEFAERLAKIRSRKKQT